jgi:hypothetical protein
VSLRWVVGDRRWCDGKCERELPLDAYRPGRAQCRDCERAKSRKRNYRRYHHSRAYHLAVLARMRDYYQRKKAA